MSAVHVAVGVIISADKKVLISKRADHLHQGGLWEFPGGKVEKGETVESALSRELKEELDIEIGSARPLMKVNHEYVDKQVLLDIWVVDSFRGKPIGAEDQALEWVAVTQLANFDFPAANEAIVKKIQSQFAADHQQSLT